MRNLDELRWEQFHIGDIFSVERPSARNKDNYEDGDVPFVASGAINNGVMKCCKPKDDEKLDKRECITVSPVDGSTFYQAYDFLGRGGAGSSVLLLRSAYNELLSGQFIARMISQTCSKYTYGHMGNKESIKREIIQLPTTDEYKPDYQYMASYSNQKRLALLEKYRVYAKTRIAELGEPMEIPAITQKKWEPVLVSDIFDILSGKRLVAADTTPGDRPFIGALDNSNGIARFVIDTNVSLDKNVLCVNYDGNGMVIGFYHPYECIFSDSVKRFHLKNHEDKAFVLLFMKVAILQQKSKFGYLYKFNAERMANTKIMLPVTDDGAPDYEYMEQYAKNLMLRKYKQYLSYLDSKEKTDTVATTLTALLQIKNGGIYAIIKNKN